MRLIFNVTRHDIIEGTACDENWCAMARAGTRAVRQFLGKDAPECSVIVPKKTHMHITMWDAGRLEFVTLAKVRLTKKQQKFVREFDAQFRTRKYPKPARFAVELPF